MTEQAQPYPKVYRHTLDERAGRAFIRLLICAALGGFMVYAGVAYKNPEWGRLLLIVFGVMLTVMGFVISWIGITSKILMYEDKIVATGEFVNATIHKARIAKKWYRIGPTGMIDIEVWDVDPKVPGLIITVPLRFDADFRAWFEGIPDIDFWPGLKDGPEQYPRTYRYGWGSRVWRSLLALLCLAFSAFFVFVLIFDRAHSKGWGTDIAMGLGGLIFFILAVVVLIDTYRGSLTLFEDRIEYQGVLFRLIIRRADILAIAGEASGDVIEFTAYLKSKKPWRVKLSSFGCRDELFFKWLSGLLHSANAAKALAMWENTAFGATRPIRERAIMADQILIWIMGLSAMGLCVWWYFVHDVRLYFAIMAVPLVVVLLITVLRGRWQMTIDSISPRHNLLVVALIPSLFLSVFGLGVLFFQMEAWIIPLSVCAASGLAGLLILAVIERRFDLNFLWNLLFTITYSLGALLWLNWYFDDVPQRLEKAKIVAMDHVYMGHIYLAPTSAESGLPKKMPVPEGAQARFQIGQEICIATYPGTLGWKWRKIADCPPSSKPI